MMNKLNEAEDSLIPRPDKKAAFSVIKSEHASKYLSVLCRHFSRKVDATWDDYQGTITFSIGVTSIQVNQAGNELSIVCQSDNKALLEEQKSVINRHVALFSRRESINLEWEDT